MNNGMPMNPSITTRIITPHITSLESGTGIGQNNGDGIPPRNKGRFRLFDRGTSNISNMSASCHGAL